MGPGGPGGPGGWGPGPGGPGLGGFCSCIASCFRFLCCCWLFDACCGRRFGGPGGPPGRF